MFFLLMEGVLSCCGPRQECDPLELMASSSEQWTGVALSKHGRIFVNYPRWTENVPVSVAEVIRGEAKPFPNKQWNETVGERYFTSVQSVVVDDSDKLWVLDTKNPLFKGVLSGGPVLYCFDLQNNTLLKSYRFNKALYKKGSYFNDVRIDTKDSVAYISDSGDGAIIVLDLQSGVARRVLDHHHSTQCERDHLVCDSFRWDNKVHIDGIALTPDGKYLYYSALTSHTLYRIATSALTDASLDRDALAQKVEKITQIPATDGMIFDKKGNLWMGGIEHHSINMIDTKGRIHQVIQDKRIRWADSFAIDNDGYIYFTISQIHVPEKKREAYQLYRFLPTQLLKKLK